MKFRSARRVNLLEDFDLLADPVTMTYQGLKQHPTYCGGIVTILVAVTVAITFG